MKGKATIQNEYKKGKSSGLEKRESGGRDP